MPEPTESIIDLKKRGGSNSGPDNSGSIIDLKNKDRERFNSQFTKYAGVDVNDNIVRFGDSKYDTSETDIDQLKAGELAHLRGAKQDNLDKLGNMIPRFATRVATSVVDGTAGTLYGVGAMMASPAIEKFRIMEKMKNGEKLSEEEANIIQNIADPYAGIKFNSFFDNEFSRTTDAVNNAVSEVFPTYSTAASENAYGFNKFKYMNTYTQDIADAVAFTVGGVATGKISNGFLVKMMKLGTSPEKLKQVLDGAKNLNDIDKIKYLDKAARAFKIEDASKKLVVTAAAVRHEAGIEARDAGDTFEDQKLYELTHTITGEKNGYVPTKEDIDKIKLAKEDTENMVFGLNTAILGVGEFIQFGKAMVSSRATDAAQSALKEELQAASKDVTKGGLTGAYEVAEKSQLSKLLAKPYIKYPTKVLRAQVPESVEEWLQYVAGETSKDYNNKQYQYNESGFGEWLDSFGHGIQKGMTDEGLDQALIGFVAGPFSQAVTPGSDIYNSFKKDNTIAREKEVKDMLNKTKIQDVTKEYIKSAVRHEKLTEEQDEAIKLDDEFTVQNKQSELLTNYALSRIKLGKHADLIDELESLKDLTPEEFSIYSGMQVDKESRDKFLNDFNKSISYSGEQSFIRDFIDTKIFKTNRVKKSHDTIEHLFPGMSQGNKDRLTYLHVEIQDAQERAKKLTNEIIKETSNELPGLISEFNGKLSFNSLDNQILPIEGNESKFHDLINNKSDLNEVDPITIDNLYNKSSDIVKLQARRKELNKQYKEISENELVQKANEAKDAESEKKLEKDLTKSEPSEEEQDEENGIGFSDTTGQQAFNQPTQYRKDTDEQLQVKLEEFKDVSDPENELKLGEVQREIAQRKAKAKQSGTTQTAQDKNKIKAISTFAKNVHEDIKRGNKFEPQGTDLDFYTEFKKEIDKELEIIKELDQIINFDITSNELPEEKKLTAGQKQDKMARVISLMGLNPKTFTFQQVYNKAVEIFGKDGVAKGFDDLNNAVYAIQNSNKNDNKIKTASAKLDSSNNLVMDGAVKASENNGSTTTVIDTEVKGLQKSLSQRVRENDPTVILTPGGKLLDDVLAVANNQVEFERTLDAQGQVRTQDKYDSTGKLVFNQEQDQIVGTSEVKLGSEITFKVENPNDITDEDTHPIAIYFGEHKIGYVHNTDYVGPNTMAPVDYKSQLEKIKSLRELLLKSPEKTFKTVITEKGFGVPNISEQSIPVGSVMEADKNIKIAFNKNGSLEGFDNNENEHIETPDGLQNGAVVLLVRHPNGYLFPIYTSQVKLGEASTSQKNSPKNEVLRSINDFLSGKLNVIEAGKIAERYVRTGDAFFKFVYSADGSYVNIGGTKFNTESKPEELDKVVSNLYFNLNGKILSDKSEREVYINDIKEYGLLRTNLQANPVTLDNGTIEQTYFSQVTIKFDGQLVPESNIPEGTKEESKLSEDELKQKEKELGFEFNEDSEENNDVSYDLTEQQIESIKSNTSSVIISPKINPSVQEELKLSFAYRLLTSEKVDGADNKGLLKKYLEDTLALFKSVDNSKNPAKKKQYNRVIDIYTEVLAGDNFEKFFTNSSDFLKSLGLSEIADGFYEQLEEKDEVINQLIDGSASNEDRADNASAEFKKFLFFLPAMYKKKDGSVANRTNSLGMVTFNNYTETFKLIAQELSQYSYKNDMSSFQLMIDKLAVHPNPVVREVSRRLQLETTPFKIKRQFYTVFNQQHATFKTLLFRENKEKRTKGENPITLLKSLWSSFVNSDRNKAQQALVNEWVEIFKINGKKLGLLTAKEDHVTGESKLSINTEKGKELKARLEGFINDELNFKKDKTFSGFKFTVEPNSLSKLRDILLDTGIEISEEGLTSFLAKNHIKGSTYNAKKVLEVNLLNTIYKTISGDSDSRAEDRLWVLNNHFEKESKSIGLLAKAEYPFRTNLFSAAFRDNGKSYYTFIRHNPLSRLMQKLATYSDGKNAFIAEKRVVDAFASQSIILEEMENENTSFKLLPSILLNFKNASNKGAKSKELTESTTKEHEFVKASLFFNNGKDTSVFLSDTHSDKSTKISQEMTKQIVDGLNGSVDGTIKLTPKTKNTLRRYFTAELKRINLVNSQNEEFKDQPWKLLEEYHLTKGGKPGQGTLFNIYYFLNQEVLKESNPRLESLLYKDGKLVSEDSIDTITQELIDNEIEENFNKLFKAKKADWANLGLWKIEQTENKKSSRLNINNLIDNRYIASIAKKVGLSDSSLKLIQGNSKAWNNEQLDSANEKMLDHAIVDYVVNYAVYTNEMLMLTGDPALQGKGKGSALQRIKSTFDNVGKRNARLLASGNSGLFKKGTYNVAFAKDMKIDSKHADEYVKLLKSFYSEESVNKGYKDGDETDAQELTTVEEKLDVMLAFGKIDEAEHKHLLGLYDRKAYKKLYKEEAPEYTQSDRLNSLGVVLQPDKPVQVADMLNKELNLTQQYYIKTSSFPLLPDLIGGTEIGKLLDLMKKNDVQRLVFRTGVKIGLPVESKSIFNEDGTVNKDFFKNNITELSREHFTIQLEVPFYEDKKAVKEGTQMMKLIFLDLPYNLMTSLGLIKDIQKDYVEIHKRIVDLEKDKLYKEIGAVNTEGGLVISNLKALSDLLIREGKDRGYDISSLLGLEIDTATGTFKTPLTFLTNGAQIEPVITALLTNRLSKTMMPGRSYVQGSEVVFRRRQVVDLENYKDKRGIVWTKPEYANMDKLKFVSVEGGHTAQIILPYYFQKITKDANGKEITELIDMKQFVNAEGMMDMSKIDPELLEINGFRIPTAGHNAMMWFEVVGFLPYGTGDLAIVPSEIVAQMGSDFDVDKLFTYFYNYTLKDGELRKIPSNKSGTKEELQNAMLDIHKAILTNKDVIPMMIEPTSTDHLANVIEKLGGIQDEWLGNYDTNFQRRTYFDNMGGQLGTGITANVNTLHASAQQANLYLKTEGILFKNKEGQYFKDDATKNRVNEYKPSLYQGKQDDNSAWRLDKIFAFSGRRISSIIAEWLGASVDNAKDKLLGKGGINEHNFNVGLLMIQAGFDNEWVIPFINQPILKKYYNKLDLVTDSIETSYEANRKGLALEELIDEYKKEFEITKEEISGLPEGFTLFEYKDMLVTPLNKETALKQIAILNEFIRYKAMADDLRVVQSALRVSSNGVGATMVQMQENAAKASKLQSDKEFIGNADRIETETVEAAFTNIPKIGMQLFGRFYAYSSPAYQSITERLSVLMGKPDLFEQDYNDIYNAIQEFTYTNPELGLYTDITETRKQLLFNSEEKKSMAGRLLDLQKKYISDKFIQILTPSTSEDVNSPEYVFMGNTSNQGKEFQSEIALQWISNIISYPEGHELRVFFEDLVKYAMIVNSSQFGSSNLLKYVPYQYLEQIKFGQILNDLDLQDEDLLNNFIEQFLQHNPKLTKFTKEDNVENIEYKQIEIDGQLVRSNKILSFTVPQIDAEKNKAFNLIQKIELPGGSSYTKYRDYVSIYDTEVQSRILFKKSEEGGVTKYTRLDKLGNNNSNEYNWNKKSQNTLIQSQKADIVQETITAPVLPNEPLNDTSTQDFKKVFTESQDIVALLSNVQVRSQSSMNNSEMKVVYGELAYQLKNSTGIEKVDLTFNGKTSFYRNSNGILLINIGSDSFGTEDNAIRIILHEAVHSVTADKLNDKEFQKTEEYKQAKIVHNKYIDHLKSEGKKTNVFGATTGEIKMALFNVYSELFRGDQYNKSQNITDKSKGFDAYKIIKDAIALVDEQHTFVSDESQKSEDHVYAVLLDNLGLNRTERFSEEQEKIILEQLKEIEDNFVENKAKYYPAFSLKEFFSEAMTNKVTQDILKSIKSDKKDIKSPSLWDKFIQAIISLNNLVSSEPTLLTEAMESIIAVIDYANKKEVKAEEKIELKAIESPIYQEFGTYYKFKLSSDGLPISGEYKQGNTGQWNPMNNKGLDSKYDQLVNDGKAMKPAQSLSKDEVKDKYELFPGVFANEGQRQAIDKLNAFLKDGTQKVFVLVGRGGTGKTTIIKKILEGLPSSKRVKGLAPSHKAKKVLGKSIGKNKVGTIASALGIKINETTGEFQIDEYSRQRNGVPIQKYDILIIDEASMVSDETLAQIKKDIKPGTKLIFMGDNAQLPPVGQESDSIVFNEANKFELVEKMRQAKGSPIITIGETIAKNIESDSPVLNAIAPEDRVASYNEDSKSSTEFINDKNMLVDKFLDDLKKSEGDVNYVKIITFNNENHSSPTSVKNINRDIREKLYGEDAKNQFNDGERVTAYGSFSRDMGADQDEMQVNNSDDFTVKSFDTSNQEITVKVFSKKQGERSFSKNYNVVDLELLDDEGKAIPGHTVPVIAESSRAEYEADLAKLWNTDKQLAFAVSQRFANIQYGYAITAHKSQGSTYRNVYVIEGNILGPTNGSDVRSKNKALYVAVSRPTTKLIVFNDTKGISLLPENINFDINSENLGQSLGDFLKTLTKEQRSQYYKLIDSKLLEKTCK